MTIENSSLLNLTTHYNRTSHFPTESLPVDQSFPDFAISSEIFSGTMYKTFSTVFGTHSLVDELVCVSIVEFFNKYCLSMPTVLHCHGINFG